MALGKLLQPNLILDGSVLGLTSDLVRQFNLKGLVLDVDETLVPIRASALDDAVLPWLQEMQQLTAIWLVSNNISEHRISRIASQLGVPYIAGAGKPSRRKLRLAVQQMQLPPHQIAMVGDRLFTDVLAGNRLGMFSVLVKPMVKQDQAKPSLLHSCEFTLSQWVGVSLKAGAYPA
jgi:uncharacterized protein